PLHPLDPAGQLVCRFASTDRAQAVDIRTLHIDPRWIRPARNLPATAGSHRFVWDLHYPPPEGAPRTYPISAVYRDTPSGPLGPAVLPGTYTGKLTVGGKSAGQTAGGKVDPRGNAPAAGPGPQVQLP